jgi:hypothetical protein
VLLHRPLQLQVLTWLLWVLCPGTDTTLLALAGKGHSRGKAFGFMSCERTVGASEGVNVLQERRRWVPDASGHGGVWRYSYCITNVEYTEFERLGITDTAQEGSKVGGGPGGGCRAVQLSAAVVAGAGLCSSVTVREGAAAAFAPAGGLVHVQQVHVAGQQVHVTGQQVKPALRC